MTSYAESGERQEQLWNMIQYHGIGELPDNMNDTELSVALAKRAIVSTFDDPDCTANIVDLLADLRHLCDAIELDYDDCDRVAKNHYENEVFQKYRIWNNHDGTDAAFEALRMMGYSVSAKAEDPTDSYNDIDRINNLGVTLPEEDWQKFLHNLQPDPGVAIDAAEYQIGPDR